jgi:hypothetical protein
MNKCTICNKEFLYPYLLERHKNNKKTCNFIETSYNCDLCKAEFNHKSHLERHNKTKKHINKYNVHIESLNIENLNLNIDNSININQTIVNGFSETNIDIIELKDIERLLLHEDKIHKFIKDFTEYPDEIYGDSQYLVLIFKFFIKIFAKLNFNLAYSENHNCMIFSFTNASNSFIEYHLLEIDNTQFNYNKKCIDYKLFIEQFLNLMHRIHNKFENETFDYILKYVNRYKKMLFTSESFKLEIENELLTSYNDFEKSKNTKLSDDEEFRIALLTARANSFKGIIRRIK